jgi:hypothetical protein
MFDPNAVEFIQDNLWAVGGETSPKNLSSTGIAIDIGGMEDLNLSRPRFSEGGLVTKEQQWN